MAYSSLHHEKPPIFDHIGLSVECSSEFTSAERAEVSIPLLKGCDRARCRIP